jgi:hypothetical protein
MAISTNGTIITRLAGALYNTQMSNSTYSEVAALDPATLANTLYARDFSSSTDLAVATTLVTNLGLASVTGLSDWVAAQLTAAGSAKGAKVVDLLNSFAQMTADTTYGTYATAFNTKVDASLALSQTIGNKGATFAAAGVVVPTAPANATFTLLSTIDAVVGGAGDDTINATHLTLNVTDVISGGAGTDTLAIIDSGTSPFTAPSASISGIENVSIRNLNTGAVTLVTAVAQVTTIVPKFAAANSDVITVIYGTQTQAVTLTGVTNQTGADTNGAIIAAAINGMAGATIAVYTTPNLVVTAPAAGTALPVISFSTATATADYPTVTATTANKAGVTAVASADTVNAALFVGATSFTSDLSSNQVDFTGMVAGQSLTIKGNTAVSNGATTAAWGATVTSPIVNIQGGTTGTGAVTLTAAGATNVTINSNGVPATSTGAIGTNTIGALSTGGTATGTLTIVADSNLSTGSTPAGITTAVKTINVSGGALLVTLGAITSTGSALTTIDASGMTAGGVLTTLVAGVTSFKGGSGNDTITTANVSTAASIDAGVGTDVLRIGAYADVDTLAEAKTFINFETVDTLALTGTTVDLALFTASTITGLRSGVAAAPAFSNVTAAQAANITITGNQSTSSTYGVINAAQVGQIDTMNVTVSDGSSTVATITLAALTAAGVEVVNLTATDDIVLTALTGLTGLTSSTITGAGTVGITTGALAANINGNVNAVANTGGLTWNSQSATGNGFAVTGSATKANTFTGARALADVFVGGAGVDTFVNAINAAAVTTAGDIFTGGAASDIFTLRGNVASGVGSTIYATAPRITDFTVGVGGDLLQLSSTLANYSGATGFQGLTAATAVAAGTTVIQSVPVNAAGAAISTGAAMLKLTSGVAESATFQTMFNAAIGTSTITGVTSGAEIFFTLYDTTNSRMAIGLVDAVTSNATIVDSGDIVTLIGTINMSAADYALFTTVNLGIIVA